MEEFAHRDEGVIQGNRAMTVNRAIAQRINDSGLAEYSLAGGLLEARLVDQSGKVVLVRQLQRTIVPVGPRNSQLERASGVEAGPARVRMHRGLRSGGGVEDRRPFSLQEDELAHCLQIASESAVLERREEAVKLG